MRLRRAGVSLSMLNALLASREQAASDGAVWFVDVGARGIQTCQDFRGRLVCIPDSTNPSSRTRYMISGGTLTAAIYHASKLDPSNRHVQAIRQSGIDDVMELDHRTPKDVQVFIKNEGNEWHQGGAYNVLEYYDDLEVVVCVAVAGESQTHSH